MFPDPSTSQSTGLFIRDREEDEVPVESATFPLERDQGHQIDDSLSLDIEGASAVNATVFDGPLQRWSRPVFGIGRDDIDVVQQNEGAPGGGPLPRVHSHEVCPATPEIEHLGRDTFPVEDFP